MEKIMKPKFLVVDLFCGFGGTTTGFEMTNGLAKVIACVNHDPKAIKSHWLNYKHVKHFEEDIRTLNLSPLLKLIEKNKLKYPDAKLILWASLECTNFSKAKGGQPRDADSRTLAEHLNRYVDFLNPDYIMIENVVEFMSWGPLDENGKPICRKNGEDWLRWCKSICALGYYDEWRELNSANYGAYTSRNRLFGCFAKFNLSIHWPVSTHAKNPDNGLFEHREKWKAVKDVLDFNDEGESIFTRKIQLSEKTLERIYAGLIKYIANGEKEFIAKYYSGRPDNKVNSVNQPCATIKTVDGLSLIQSKFLLKYNSTNGKTGKYVPPSIENPCPTISTQGRLGVVETKFLDYYYGISCPSSMNEPAKTLRTKDTASLIKASYFINRDLKDTNSSIDSAAGSITTVPKMNLVEAKRYFLLNPQFNNNGSSIEKPCFTLIAKMDKRPPYLIESEMGEIGIEIYKSDSEMTIKIKEFMAIFGILDVKMRMLRVKELLKIQGFPDDYKMEGNQSDQKKFIGNSVVPHVVMAWCKAMANDNDYLKLKTA